VPGAVSGAAFLSGARCDLRHKLISSITSKAGNESATRTAKIWNTIAGILLVPDRLDSPIVDTELSSKHPVCQNIQPENQTVALCCAASSRDTLPDLPQGTRARRPTPARLALAPTRRALVTPND
jgi:hypothetical protein